VATLKMVIATANKPGATLTTNRSKGKKSRSYKPNWGYRNNLNKLEYNRKWSKNASKRYKNKK
jgi:hypothetical protein